MSNEDRSMYYAEMEVREKIELSKKNIISDRSLAKYLNIRISEYALKLYKDRGPEDWTTVDGPLFSDPLTDKTYNELMDIAAVVSDLAHYGAASRPYKTTWEDISSALPKILMELSVWGNGGIDTTSEQIRCVFI